jgi:hypothetical protein
MRRWLFNGDRSPTCLDAADANDDGQVDISDTIFILDHAVLGGPPVPAPYLEVGPDLTADDVPCPRYDVVTPVETADVVRIAKVEAAPGQVAHVPVLLTNSVEVEAFQLVIRYDPDLFTPLGELSFVRMRPNVP